MGLMIVGPHGSTGKGCGTCGAAMCTCGTCTIPQANLTLSYSNLIIGDGTTPLVYASGARPASGIRAARTNCTVSTDLHGRASRVPGVLLLPAPAPPARASIVPTSDRPPNGLTQTGLTCGSAFLLACTVNSSSCPNIATYGYTGFAVSYP